MINEIGAASQTSTSATPQASPEPITISLKDGELLVEQGANSSHPLADTHCDPCVTAFNQLKSDADKGIRPELYALAVEQTERQQKVLGAVTQPGPVGLDGLSADGKIRAVSGSPAAQGQPRISVSREGARRAARMAEIAKRFQISGEDPRSAPTAQVDASKGDGTHSADDGHGHASMDDSAEADKSIKGHAHGAGDEALTADELKQVEELEKRDAEVRAHEQAHKGAAGSHGGSISYTYQTGPNGKKYAVGGEVPVNISPIKGDPEATISKMQTIRRAALAPADPSAADRRIAARATQYVVEAQAELMVEKREAPKTLSSKSAQHDGPNNATTTSPEPEGSKKPAGESVSTSGQRAVSPAVDDAQAEAPTPPTESATSNSDISAGGPAKFEAADAQSSSPSGAPIRRALRQYGATASGPSHLNTYG